MDITISVEDFDNQYRETNKIFKHILVDNHAYVFVVDVYKYTMYSVCFYTNTFLKNKKNHYFIKKITLNLLFTYNTCPLAGHNIMNK